MLYIGPSGECGWSKDLLGADVWISNNGGEEGWFLSLEEGVYNQHSTDLDVKKIFLQRLGLF